MLSIKLGLKMCAVLHSPALNSIMLAMVIDETESTAYECNVDHKIRDTLF